MTQVKHSQSIQNSTASNGNITQVGRDYTNTTSINLSIWISLLLVIALGSYVALGTDILDNFFSPAESAVLGE